MKPFHTPARGRGLALSMLLAAASAPMAAPQAVYRCGQTYQQTPCPAGPAQALDVADRRTTEQRQDARAAASAESRQARELAAERKARDKTITPQTTPMGIAAPQSDEPASAAQAGASGKKKKRKKTEDPRYWSAPAAKGK